MSMPTIAASRELMRPWASTHCFSVWPSRNSIQKPDAAVVAVGAVDGNHVRVTNAREQTALGDHRPLERLGVGVLDVQELERDIPRELGIPRAIHGAVAAAADELPELQRSPAIDGLRITGPRGVIGADGSRSFVVAVDVGDGGEDLELAHQLPLVV